MRRGFYPAVAQFLEANGLQYVNGSYENDKCRVSLGKGGGHYELEEFGKGVMFSRDESIYWLIGVLTWGNLIEQPYNKPGEEVYKDRIATWSDDGKKEYLAGIAAILAKEALDTVLTCGVGARMSAEVEGEDGVYRLDFRRVRNLST